MAAHYAFEGARGNVQERQLLACQSAGCIDGVIDSEDEALGGGGDDWDEIFGGGQTQQQQQKQKQRRRRHWTDALLECDDIMDVSMTRARWTQRPNCYVCKGRIELLNVGLASIAVTAAINTNAVLGLMETRDNGLLRKRDRAREISQLCVDAALKGYYRLAYALWKCGGGALMSVLDVLTEAEGLYGVNYSRSDRNEFNELGNRVLQDIAGLLRIEKLSPVRDTRLSSGGDDDKNGEEAKVDVRAMLGARYSQIKAERYPWDEINLTGGEYIDGPTACNDNAFRTIFPGFELQMFDRDKDAITSDTGNKKQFEYRLAVKSSRKDEEDEEKASPIAASRGLRVSASYMLDDGTILCSECCASIWILDELCEESSRKTSMSTIVDPDANADEDRTITRENSPDRIDVDIDAEHVNTKGTSDSDDKNRDSPHQSFRFEKKTFDGESVMSDLQKGIFSLDRNFRPKTNSNSPLSTKAQEISRAILKSISIAGAATPVKFRSTIATTSSSSPLSSSKTDFHNLRICPTCHVAAFCSLQCYNSAQDYHMSLCETGLEDYLNAGVIMDNVLGSTAPPPEKQKLVGQALLKVMGLAKGRKMGPLRLPVVKYMKCGVWRDRKGDSNGVIAGKDDGIRNDSAKDKNKPTTDTPYSNIPWSYDANVLRPLHALYTLGGENLSLDTEDYDGWMINTLFAKIYYGLRTHPVDKGERVEKHFDAVGRLVAQRVVVEEQHDTIREEGGGGSQADMNDISKNEQTSTATLTATGGAYEANKDTDKASTTWIASLDPLLDYVEIPPSNDKDGKEDSKAADAQLYRLGSNLLCVPPSMRDNNSNENNEKELGDGRNYAATISTDIDSDDKNAKDSGYDEQTQRKLRMQRQTEMKKSGPGSGSGSGSGSIIIRANTIKMILREEDVHVGGGAERPNAASNSGDAAAAAAAAAADASAIAGAAGADGACDAEEGQQAFVSRDGNGHGLGLGHERGDSEIKVNSSNSVKKVRGDGENRVREDQVGETRVGGEDERKGMKSESYMKSFL